MNPPLLLCTDLDRTLLPNGRAPESPGARDALAGLVERERIDLAYVSGRDLLLVLEAIESYGVPEPRWIVGDVGTSLHESAPGGWRSSGAWRERILADWRDASAGRLLALLGGIEGLTPQPPDRQGPAKVSFFTAPDANRSGIETGVERLLRGTQIRYRAVWSLDEVADRGLLDILPASASKLHAIEFLMEMQDRPRSRVLFAGDSGNDLEVLASDLPSVLVANARPEVRERAVALAAGRGHRDALFLARGGVLGMNGNYAAGILEGIAHYFPGVARGLLQPPGGSNEGRES